MAKKIFFIVLSLGLALLAAFFAFRAFMFSDFTVNIEGYHNPLTTDVLVGNKKLYPSGKDGKIYETRIIRGEKTVSLNGPDVKPSSVKVNIGTEKSIVIKSEKISANDVAVNLLKDEAISVSVEGYFFGTGSDWLIAVEKSSSNVESDVFYLYRYLDSTSSWELMNSGEKISSDQILSQNGPQEAVNFLDFEAGD